MTQESLKFKRRKAQYPIRQPQAREENGTWEAMLRIWKWKTTGRGVDGDDSGATMEIRSSYVTKTKGTSKWHQ